MERRLNKRINDYIHTFKTNIVDNIKSTATSNEPHDIIQFIYNYEKFEIN